MFGTKEGKLSEALLTQIDWLLKQPSRYENKETCVVLFRNIVMLSNEKIKYLYVYLDKCFPKDSFLHCVFRSNIQNKPTLRRKALLKLRRLIKEGKFFSEELPDIDVDYCTKPCRKCGSWRIEYNDGLQGYECYQCGYFEGAK